MRGWIKTKCRICKEEMWSEKPHARCERCSAGWRPPGNPHPFCPQSERAYQGYIPGLEYDEGEENQSEDEKFWTGVKRKKEES